MAAEVGGGDDKKKKGKKGRKKAKIPKIDMTPMVDLGFLLLTFFILTTTLSTPTTMPVVVPPKKEPKTEEEKPDKIAESRVFTIMLGAKNRAYYYQGVKEPELHVTGFSKKKGIRDACIDAMDRLKTNPSIPEKDKTMLFLIKITDKAVYKNMVDILDEMNVLGQKSYALVDITPQEVDMIEKYEKQFNLEQ